MAAVKDSRIHVVKFDPPGDETLSVPALVKYTNEMGTYARRLKADNIAQICRRTAARLRAVKGKEGTVYHYDARGVEVPTITIRQWDRLTELTGYADLDKWWRSHLGQAVEGDDSESDD